jgi:hypothetical protein
MRRGSGVVSAVRAADGRLKLIAWRVDGGGAITRAGDSYDLAGEATRIALCSELSGGTPVVTAVRTAAGDLKLIGWDD